MANSRPDGDDEERIADEAERSLLDRINSRPYGNDGMSGPDRRRIADNFARDAGVDPGFGPPPFADQARSLLERIGGLLGRTKKGSSEPEGG
jgi:hypothetical protein